MICILALAGLISDAAAQQIDLPAAPTSQIEQVRPFAVGVGVVERIVVQTGPHNTATTGDFIVPSIFINYRFDHNRFNINTSVGRSNRSGNFSSTTSLSMNLFKFGRIGK